ncbi:FAD dependent oxidoreductase [Boeremia exigua]|uniref:FAD dependent oxidoreductase n=1 Tax=Boeremia exigua TaxID=749465 RepID=UPI001E8D882A|nr:FAD dependent oxidoreductase [Boeremia exigua]KAH6628984.1 FAD dependent oxidoreductase [Boeremia exigua]
MTTTSSSPHPSGMDSFWRSQLGELDRHRTTPELPAEVDVLVIGAGYSSASFVTHFLASEAAASSVLVLEARQLCSGATGRNGGHLKPDYYYGAAGHAAEYGLDAAAEVAEFEHANLQAVSDFIIENNVDCDYIVTRAVDVQLGDDVYNKAKAGYELLKKSRTGKDVFAIPDSLAEKISGVKKAKSAFSFTSGHLWPYKLTHHLFADALRKGINLQTETPVQGISKSPDENGNWIVHTQRGMIRAKKVVATSNAYTSSYLPEYKDKIIPYRAICCRITCPEQSRPRLNNTYALRFADWDFDYLIPRPDGSIVVGGARSAYLSNKDVWYDSVDDSRVIEQARSYFDGYMQRHFHGWEDSEAAVSDIWTGIMGYSSDRLPRVGEVPSRPGVFIMGGFTGHGMAQIFLTAKGLAGMIRDGDTYDQTGIPRIFQESPQRLASPENKVLKLWKTAAGAARL